MVRPLVIDCDPGVDDAIAILLACAAPERFEILGITTVAGNVPLPLTHRNARQICALAGRPELPVYAGCPRPLVQPLQTAVDVHGATGLQGAVLPEPTQPAPTQHGVDFLIQTLATAPRPITLAALGPLTNLAVALIQAPQLVEQVAELVIMGGAITQGNITPSAEFNIFVDPHAAQVVLAAGWPITLITLETTHQVLTTPARLAALRQIGTPVAQVAADLLTHYGQSDIERYGMAGAPLHDPCVIAYLLQPELFSAAAAYVTVETTGRHTLGRTVVDSWGLTGQSPNARVVQSVNVEGLYDLLLTRLGQL